MSDFLFQLQILRAKLFVKFAASLEVLPHAKFGGNSGEPHHVQPYSVISALSDFRRSVWLRAKADAVVQYCKNCLLVSTRCLFPPIFACG